LYWEKLIRMMKKKKDNKTVAISKLTKGGTARAVQHRHYIREFSGGEGNKLAALRKTK
jgi:hypothetical protein